MRLRNGTNKRLVVCVSPPERILLVESGAVLEPDPVSGLQFEILAIEDAIPPIVPGDASSA